jgi:hypothetical protein
VEGSGIAPRRRPIRHEAAKPTSMARDELVGRVDEPRQSEGTKNAAERAGQPDLGEERHAPSAVAGNQCAVAKDEPPTLAALVLGHGREQRAGLLIGERE